MASFELTPSQKKAIRYMPNHSVQLIACAGSGKTEIVSRGVAEIIRQGTAPEHVVAFTFTEKAADELKARIRKILLNEGVGDGGLGDMYVGTIHSFCFERLKELAPEFRGYDVLDEAARMAYVSKPANWYQNLALQSIQSGNGWGKYRLLENFLDSIDIMLDENIDLEDIAATDGLLADSLARYHDQLHIDHYLDFSHMISELVQRLESDKTIRKAMQDRTKYLVVDEYQDVNGLQERLIKGIVGKQTRITVVGDDDQSIYAWRGAVVDNIIDFVKRYRDVKQVRLEDNFRSTPSIIELANKYIRWNSNRLRKKMLYPKYGKLKSTKTDIQYRHFKTEDEQADFIAQRIDELEGADFALKDGSKVSLGRGDIAILVRANKDIQRLLPLLDARDIEYVVDSGETVFDRPIIEQTHDLLDYVFGLSNSDLPTLLRNYRRFLKDEGYRQARRANFDGNLKKLRARLDRIKRKDPKDYLPDLGLQGIFHELLQAMEINKVELSEPDHFYLATFSQAVSDYEQVWQRLRHKEYKYFKGFITAWGQKAYSAGSASATVPLNAVKVLTIHKAKGLEFPAVFVPYLNKKKKPNFARSMIDRSLFDASRYKGDEEDERRIYYVALTRAQKYLFLSGMEDDPDVKAPRRPHDLLGELDQSLLSPPRVLKPRRSGHPQRRESLHDLTTSFSDLSAYGRCAYDYKLRHIFGYNAGVPVAFGYGTQIHNILNVIHSAYRDGDICMGDVTEIVDKHFYLRFAPGNINEHLKKAAEGIVKNYVKSHADEFKDVLETEKSFEFSMGDTLIAGQIDLIKKLDDSGALKEVEVVDFKSDKRLLYKRDYDHQIRLYVMACLKALGLSPQRACIHDLESGKKRYVNIAPADMEVTEKELGERIDGIRRSTYRPTKNKSVCSECDYMRICKHWRTA